MFYKFIINEHAVLSRKPTNEGRKDEDLGLLHEGVREAVRTRSKISPSRRDGDCVILPMRRPCRSPVQRQNLGWWVPGAGEGDDGEVVFHRDGVSVGKTRKFCGWRMVAQPREVSAAEWHT
uniref:Uncharacterized protein n=1 Tax=Rousettus aegyptiacus TaxID=9407 RepID=A0A7J8H2R4_ROUAE|nr:hypothetical protein HJG63_011411 [Rousettus aegyptiacus]